MAARFRIQRSAPLRFLMSLRAKTVVEVFATFRRAGVRALKREPVLRARSPLDPDDRRISVHVA